MQHHAYKKFNIKCMQVGSIPIITSLNLKNIKISSLLLQGGGRVWKLWPEFCDGHIDLRGTHKSINFKN